ncbi:hypothetical protein EB001_00205 [bacterium]|nr:hypothetical protein [bacterium]
MNNDPMKVIEFAHEVFSFDHTYYYSDDFGVWRNGEAVKKKLREKATSMNLSVGDKILMIENFKRLWNENKWNGQDRQWEMIDAEHICWPYKASMYGIIGITERDYLFVPSDIK